MKLRDLQPQQQELQRRLEEDGKLSEEDEECLDYLQDEIQRLLDILQQHGFVFPECASPFFELCLFCVVAAWPSVFQMHRGRVRSRIVIRSLFKVPCMSFNMHVALVPRMWTCFNCWTLQCRLGLGTENADCSVDKRAVEEALYADISDSESEYAGSSPPCVPSPLQCRIMHLYFVEAYLFKLVVTNVCLHADSDTLEADAPGKYGRPEKGSRNIGAAPSWGPVTPAQSNLDAFTSLPADLVKPKQAGLLNKLRSGCASAFMNIIYVNENKAHDMYRLFVCLDLACSSHGLKAAKVVISWTEGVYPCSVTGKARGMDSAATLSDDNLTAHSATTSSERPAGE
jgi:hypothetical protein